MTNECILLIETELPIPMKCADGTGIEKGTTLKLSDLMVVAKADGDNDFVGGIAGTEKIADDGMVGIDVYRGGIFRGKASGSIGVGDSLGFDADSNQLISSVNTDTLSGSKVVGTSFEAADDGHTFMFELRPQNINSTK